MQKEKPAFAFSSLLIPQGKTFRLRLYSLKESFFWIALFFFCLPLCNPVVTQKGPLANKTAMPRKGIAIYLLIDESGSMEEKLRFDEGFAHGEEMSKSDWVKRLASDLIEKRKHDLIGLIGFARKANIICPLTLDRAELSRRLNDMRVVQKDEEEGTAIGYAIYKTVNFIVSTKHFAERAKEKKEPSYSIENQVIIVLTDGLQSPNPLDRDNPFRFMRPEDSIDYAEKNGIRVYYVGVDPVLQKEQFSYEAKKMKEAVLSSKGDFFISTSTEPLHKIYEQLDVLQKSEIPQNANQNELPQEHLRSLAPLCIMIGMLMLLFGCLIETVFARTAP